MDLAREYHRQLAWRRWPQILDALPSLVGATVLDLGCAVGDQTALLVERGARVIGVDSDARLLDQARSRGLVNAQFVLADLSAPLPLDLMADGIWCSFTAAYFPELAKVLTSWRQHLRPGGWIALTEIDDLFGHEPLPSQTKAALSSYAADALSKGRYDFYMGRKLPTYLEEAGFPVSRVFVVDDDELSFTGPAPSEVVEAWRSRFDRMGPLRSFCGDQFEQIRDDFLSALAHAEHRSTATVCCCIATN